MILILVLVAEINLQPQYYTNTNYYYEISGRDSIIYGATNGGVIAFNKQTKGFRVLTNTDGLQMNRQHCLGLDSSGCLWVGNELGLAQVDDMFDAIQIYPIQYLTGTCTQEIVCQRDSVYVGSTDGLLFINTMGTPADFSDDVRMKIFESEGLPSKNVLTIALDDTSVWVGTDDGLVRFSKDFQSHSSVTKGLLDKHINKIFIMDTSVYVATGSGLNSFQGNYFDTLLFDTLLINEQVFDINCINDSLVLALDSISQVGIFHQGSLTVIDNGIPYLCRVNSLLNITGDIYCGLGNRYHRDYFGEGIGQYDFGNNLWALTKRPCLPSNHISDITANEFGVFVACGSRNSDSKGFGWLNNAEEWINFSRDSILPSNHVHRCVTAPDGKVWFAMNTISPSDTVLVFSYEPEHDNWYFMRKGYHNMDTTEAVWDIQFDARNNMFLALAGSSDKIWVIDSAREEVYFLDWQIGFVVEMAVDSEGKIWRTFVTHKTLLMIDTQNTLFDRSDDVRAEFALADGLVSTYAYGCIVDQDDNFYLANESGFVIYDGVDFKAMTNVSSEELFDVEMDSEERVWIMARDGLYYYDPKLDILGGWRYYELGVHIEFFVFSNELIQVQGFEFDPWTRCLWLAGETGLLKVAVQYDTTIPLDSILIYPNPVLGNKGSLRIKNLPVDALVNIYAISGRLLIDNLQPDPVFGEVVWSIPDDIGSGLYFALVRSSMYGNKVCKFAIVR
ncbi:MAG: hypothetical protein WBB67_00110 [bacterium]